MKSPQRRRGFFAGLVAAREVLHGVEEAELGAEVLAPVGDVDGGDGGAVDVGRDDAVLVIELGMPERGRGGGDSFVDEEGDAGVALEAVPVAPVFGVFAQGLGDVFAGGFGFLEADEVGRFAGEPRGDLFLPGADAIDVPGGDFHYGESASTFTAWAWCR